MWWVGAEGAGRPVRLLGPEPKVLGQPVSGRGLGGGAAVRREGDRARLAAPFGLPSRSGILEILRGSLAVEHATPSLRDHLRVHNIYTKSYRRIFGAHLWLPADAWLNGMSRSSGGRCPGIESRWRRSDIAYSEVYTGTRSSIVVRYTGPLS